MKKPPTATKTGVKGRKPKMAVVPETQVEEEESIDPVEIVSSIKGNPSSGVNKKIIEVVWLNSINCSDRARKTELRK